MALPANKGTREYDKFVEDASGDVAVRVQMSSGDIEIGAVELKNADSDVRANINAANTARTTATVVIATQNIDAAGNVIGIDAANTARTTATKVLPVQVIAADGSVGITSVASLADGADVTQGAKADARSTATDTTAVSVMSVLKEISYMEQNPASRAITAATLPLPTGASTSALQGGGLPAALGAGGGLKVDGSGTALPVSGTVAVSNTEFALPAAQVTTLTPPAAITGFATSALQGAGLPAALGAGGGMKIDGSGTALPVSGTVTATFADGADVTQGAKADARSTATDATAVTLMQVAKEISYMEQNPASRAVTNAGTFAVQPGSALTGPGNPTVDSYGSIAINLAAGADQVLVSSAASKQIWVYGFAFTTNVAGTVSFQDEDNVALSGVMQIGITGGIAMAPSGNFSMPIWKLGTDKDLEVDVVTAELDGTLQYAIVSV